MGQADIGWAQNELFGPNFLLIFFLKIKKLSVGLHSNGPNNDGLNSMKGYK